MSEAASSEKALGKRKKLPKEDTEFEPEDAKDNEDTLEEEEKLDQGDTKVCCTASVASHCIFPERCMLCVCRRNCRASRRRRICPSRRSFVE